jgi:predicted acetyltransferase
MGNHEAFGSRYSIYKESLDENMQHVTTHVRETYADSISEAAGGIVKSGDIENTNFIKLPESEAVYPIYTVRDNRDSSAVMYRKFNDFITVDAIDKNLNNTPALYLAVQGWLEVWEDNKEEAKMGVFWDDSAILAYVGKKAVGVITYHFNEFDGSYNVRIGYVDPKYRRLGVYGKMWNTLVDEAQKYSIRTILSNVDMGNKTMLAVATKCAGSVLHHQFSYAVEHDRYQED